MKASLAAGCNFWNAGEFYGTESYNSLHLLNRYFTKYPEDADKVVLSIKGVVCIFSSSVFHLFVSRAVTYWFPRSSNSNFETVQLKNMHPDGRRVLQIISWERGY
jgi:hypothetical protein